MAVSSMFGIEIFGQNLSCHMVIAARQVCVAAAIMVIDGQEITGYACLTDGNNRETGYLMPEKFYSRIRK